MEINDTLEGMIEANDIFSKYIEKAFSLGLRIEQIYYEFLPKLMFIKYVIDNPGFKDMIGIIQLAMNFGKTTTESKTVGLLLMFYKEYLGNENNKPFLYAYNIHTANGVEDMKNQSSLALKDNESFLKESFKKLYFVTSTKRMDIPNTTFIKYITKSQFNDLVNSNSLSSDDAVIVVESNQAVINDDQFNFNVKKHTNSLQLGDEIQYGITGEDEDEYEQTTENNKSSYKDRTIRTISSRDSIWMGITGTANSLQLGDDVSKRFVSISRVENGISKAYSAISKPVIISPNPSFRNKFGNNYNVVKPLSTYSKRHKRTINGIDTDVYVCHPEDYDRVKIELTLNDWWDKNVIMFKYGKKGASIFYPLDSIHLESLKNGLFENMLYSFLLRRSKGPINKDHKNLINHLEQFVGCPNNRIDRDKIHTMIIEWSSVMKGNKSIELKSWDDAISNLSSKDSPIHFVFFNMSGIEGINIKNAVTQTNWKIQQKKKALYRSVQRFGRNVRYVSLFGFNDFYTEIRYIQSISPDKATFDKIYGELLRVNEALFLMNDSINSFGIEFQIEVFKEFVKNHSQMDSSFQDSILDFTPKIDKAIKMLMDYHRISFDVLSDHTKEMLKTRTDGKNAVDKSVLSSVVHADIEKKGGLMLELINPHIEKSYSTNTGVDINCHFKNAFLTSILNTTETSLELKNILGDLYESLNKKVTFNKIDAGNDDYTKTKPFRSSALMLTAIVLDDNDEVDFDATKVVLTYVEPSDAETHQRGLTHDYSVTIEKLVSKPYAVVCSLNDIVDFSYPDKGLKPKKFKGSRAKLEKKITKIKNRLESKI
jgi:hypothetical protein